ncbi:Uncharacterized protein Fot_34974 [Forsythia ovata]|uniref:Uncharacterized protein n=1 Tax=Forsythia ovata TaxID=205694 RepID=A0ABD1SK72_9LAMI
MGSFFSVLGICSQYLRFQMKSLDFSSSRYTKGSPEFRKASSRISRKSSSATASIVSDGPLSLPVSVPDWSKKLKEEYRENRRQESNNDDYDEDEYEENGNRIPPHEFLALQMARTRMASFSVHEGIGRTLKGRDLSTFSSLIISSIPGRTESFWKELDYFKNMWKHRQELKLLGLDTGSIVELGEPGVSERTLVMIWMLFARSMTNVLRKMVFPFPLELTRGPECKCLSPVTSPPVPSYQERSVHVRNRSQTVCFLSDHEVSPGNFSILTSFGQTSTNTPILTGCRYSKLGQNMIPRGPDDAELLEEKIVKQLEEKKDA